MDETELIEVLLLEIDGRRVGIPSAAVIEVLPSAELAPIEKAPPFIEGFVDVRGAVLPVLSLRERLGRPARPPRVDEHLIHLMAGDRAILLRVDRALDLVGVDPSRLTPLDERHGPTGSAASTPDGVLLIQDPERFLTQQEAAALAQR